MHKFFAIALAGSSAQQTITNQKLYAIVTRKKQNFATTEWISQNVVYKL